MADQWLRCSSSAVACNGRSSKRTARSCLTRSSTPWAARLSGSRTTTPASATGSATQSRCCTCFSETSSLLVVAPTTHASGEFAAAAHSTNSQPYRFWSALACILLLLCFCPWKVGSQQAWTKPALAAPKVLSLISMALGIVCCSNWVWFITQGISTAEQGLLWGQQGHLHILLQQDRALCRSLPRR